MTKHIIDTDDKIIEEYSKQQILSFLKWIYDDEITFDIATLEVKPLDGL